MSLVEDVKKAEHTPNIIEMFFVSYRLRVKRHTYPTIDWANSAARAFAKHGYPSLVKVNKRPTLVCRPTRRLGPGRWVFEEIGEDGLVHMIVYPNTTTHR